MAPQTSWPPQAVRMVWFRLFCISSGIDGGGHCIAICCARCCKVIHSDSVDYMALSDWQTGTTHHLNRPRLGESIGAMDCERSRTPNGVRRSPARILQQATSSGSVDRHCGDYDGFPRLHLADWARQATPAVGGLPRLHGTTLRYHCGRQCGRWPCACTYPTSVLKTWAH